MLRLAAGLFAFFLAALPAAAQTPTPLSYWQFSVGQTLAPLAGPVPEWRVSLGGGVMVQPEFEGGARYHALPSLDLDVRWRDIAFLSDGEGLGVNLLHGKTYRAGIALGYDLGRDHHDAPRLSTLHNVDPAAEVKLFGEVFVLPAVLSANVRQGIGGHGGLIADLGAYVPVPLGGTLTMFLGPSLTLADTAYMRSYFRVRPSEAAGTLTPFNPEGGLKNVGFGISTVWEITQHWTLAGDIGWKELLGDAGRSPIVEDRNQLAVGLDLVYRF